MKGIYDEIERLSKMKSAVTGISTGFPSLDAKTTGLHDGELIILAARPAMGKTAFALNIAQNAAIKDDRSVAIFSLEMSKEQLVQRMLCAASLVDSNNVRTGNLSKEDWERMVVGYNTLYGASIFIDDTPGITVSEVRSKCRRLKTEKALDLIVIDYLQLMSGGGGAAAQPGASVPGGASAGRPAAAGAAPAAAAGPPAGSAGNRGRPGSRLPGPARPVRRPCWSPSRPSSWCWR